MTGSPELCQSLSIEAYLQGELETEIKHEYLAGDVVAMGGASRAHGLMATALALALGPKAKSRHCQLFISDMKVRIDHDSGTYFYYPDLVLTCHPDDNERLFSTHPCLIVEILSPTTERIDRREKLLAYRLLPSLREYLLVDPENPLIDRHWKTGEHWQHATLTKGKLAVSCLDCEIDLADLYD